MTEQQLVDLLHIIIELEHNTAMRVNPEDYATITCLARKVQAPNYIIDYFARKAVA